MLITSVIVKQLEKAVGKNADFQSIFAHSVSAVTPIAKYRLTRIGSSLYELSNEPERDKQCTLPPKGGSKNQCPKFEQYSAITSKRHEIGCQLVLITNGKSRTGCRLVPTSVTLNDLERRNSPCFALFHRIR